MPEVKAFHSGKLFVVADRLSHDFMHVHIANESSIQDDKDVRELRDFLDAWLKEREQYE